MLLATLSSALALLAGAQDVVDVHPRRWTYKSDNPGDGEGHCTFAQPCGPQHWGNLNKHCDDQGTASPIDLAKDGLEEEPEAAAEDLAITAGKPCEGPIFATTPHTLRVAVTQCEMGAAVGWKGKDYKPQQFHFHAPSEHTVDQGYYPMEMHFVHQSADSSLLVLTRLLAVDDSVEDTVPLEMLSRVMSAFKPVPEGDNYHSYNTSFAGLKPYSLYPPTPWQGFWNYVGSKTTPVCNEGAEWLIVQEPLRVKGAFVQAFREKVNANPGNALAPFADIMGPGSPASPTFAPDAGVESWDTALNCNGRSIQPLTGADNPSRKLYVVRASSSSGLKLPVVGLVVGLAAAVLALVLCCVLTAKCRRARGAEPDSGAPYEQMPAQ